MKRFLCSILMGWHVYGLGQYPCGRLIRAFETAPGMETQQASGQCVFVAMGNLFRATHKAFKLDFPKQAEQLLLAEGQQASPEGTGIEQAAALLEELVAHCPSIRANWSVVSARNSSNSSRVRVLTELTTENLIPRFRHNDVGASLVAASIFDEDAGFKLVGNHAFLLLGFHPDGWGVVNDPRSGRQLHRFRPVPFDINISNDGTTVSTIEMQMDSPTGIYEELPPRPAVVILSAIRIQIQRR